MEAGTALFIAPIVATRSWKTTQYSPTEIVAGHLVQQAQNVELEFSTHGPGDPESGATMVTPD